MAMASCLGMKRCQQDAQVRDMHSCAIVIVIIILLHASKQQSVNVKKLLKLYNNK